MRTISLKTLRSFWEKHPDAERPLRAWHTATVAAAWRSLQDVRVTYPTADGVETGTETGVLTVFNIGGNKYRLVVRINYKYQLVNVRCVLTHAEYDKGAWKE